VKIEILLQQFRGKELDPHYLGYFECFNQKRYFDAHEVLEPLWLKERGHPQALFYKGLIQFAAAFVHLQKNRRQPAISLFGLARENLRQYPKNHEGLDLQKLLETIERYLSDLSAGQLSEPLFCPDRAPQFLPEEAR